MRTIYTDAVGVPFEEPEALAPDATVEERITWMRARTAWSDRICACASAAFAKAFRAAVSK